MGAAAVWARVFVHLSPPLSHDAATREVGAGCASRPHHGGQHIHPLIPTHSFLAHPTVYCEDALSCPYIHSHTHTFQPCSLTILAAVGTKMVPALLGGGLCLWVCGCVYVYTVVCSGRMPINPAIPPIPDHLSHSHRPVIVCTCVVSPIPPYLTT